MTTQQKPKLVFKQSRGSDDFYSSQGYSIRRTQRWYHGLFDPQGNLLEESPVFWDFRKSEHLKDFTVEIHNAYERYGPSYDKIVKFNPGHLTPGTKVKLGSVTSLKELTVSHLRFGEHSGHILIVSEERYPLDTYEWCAGQPHHVDISHVTGVISRVPGSPVFEHERYYDYGTPEQAAARCVAPSDVVGSVKIKKGEVILNPYALLVYIEDVLMAQFPVAHFGGCKVNHVQMVKRLRAMNCFRAVRIPGQVSIDGIPDTPIHRFMVAVNVRKTRQLLKKYPHWFVEKVKIGVKRMKAEERQMAREYDLDN